MLLKFLLYYTKQERNNKKSSIKKCAANAPVAASLGNRLWNIITTYYIGSNCPLCNKFHYNNEPAASTP